MSPLWSGHSHGHLLRDRNICLDHLPHPVFCWVCTGTSVSFTLDECFFGTFCHVEFQTPVNLLTACSMSVSLVPTLESSDQAVFLYKDTTIQCDLCFMYFNFYLKVLCHIQQHFNTTAASVFCGG